MSMSMGIGKYTILSRQVCKELKQKDYIHETIMFLVTSILVSICANI